MKSILKQKKGFTLIEVMIAVLLLAIVSSAMLAGLTTADKITREHESQVSTKSRIPYEDAVGTMDKKLDSDTSSEAGTSIGLKVNFKDGTSHIVTGAKKIKNNDLKEISICTKD